MIGEVQGSVANVGSSITVALSYTDADGVARTADVQVTVKADGSYTVAALDLDALPQGSEATGQFTYKVKYDSNALSNPATATITVTGTTDARSQPLPLAAVGPSDGASDRDDRRAAW